MEIDVSILMSASLLLFRDRQASRSGKVRDDPAQVMMRQVITLFDEFRAGNWPSTFFAP